MRADRLVAILLLLQVRGQVTAAEVAEELEISERTARRDLDALGVAGVPVYAMRGRGGGWRLAGGGRTDLSGLNAPEVRALFLLAGPSAGATGEVKAALRKLVRALPEPLRAGAEAASSSTIVDATGWDGHRRQRPPPPSLETVRHAVVDRLQLEIAYAGRSGPPSSRVVHPLGVVAKAANWYLIADTSNGRRTFRVDRITAARPTGEPAVRPEAFDLEAEWHLIAERVDQMRAPLRVRADVARWALPYLRGTLGTRVAVVSPSGDRDAADSETGAEADRVDVEIRGHAIPSLAAELAGFGALVTVHEPAELRTALADVGAELVATYSPSGAA
ncbi:MAG: helix-turn-helix transcriptional regulator [Acidimicrobiales bacterium]